MAARDEADAGLAAAQERADHAGDGVAVGDAYGGIAEADGSIDQLLDVACAGQKGVVRGELKFHIGHEARLPDTRRRSARHP